MSTKLTTLPEHKWVNVEWMPHSSLAQTSHVTMAIRSAHLIRDRLDGPEEWRVQATVRGMGGLELVSIASSTSASAIGPRRLPLIAPTIATSTHECIWNQVIQLPIRWRDLPRDAYLQLEIFGQGDHRVSSFVENC
jgi:hypothetical protein